MADENKIFTKKASEKLRSPDNLDEYIRVTNPSIWVVLAACITLVVGLFAWGMFGTAETSVNTMGTCVEGKVVCFLPSNKASSVHVGDDANVDGKLMKVAEMSAIPLSRVESREIVGSDYLASTLVTDDWTYLLHFSGDDDQQFSEGIPLSITITTERIPPISLIFKDAA